jgi:hypothetical protein
MRFGWAHGHAKWRTAWPTTTTALSARTPYTSMTSRTPNSTTLRSDHPPALLQSPPSVPFPLPLQDTPQSRSSYTYECTRIRLRIHFLYQYSLEAEITNPTCQVAFNIASHVLYCPAIFHATPLLLGITSIHQYIHKYIYTYTNTELHQLLYHVSFDHRKRICRGE